MAPVTASASPAGNRPRSSVWGWAVAGFVVIAIISPLLNNTSLVSPYVRGIVVLAGINVMLAVSLNVINGITGQFSIGHAGFMAVGAYTGAAVTVFCGTALERWAGHGVINPDHPVLNLFLVRVGGAAPGLLAMVRGEALFAGALLAAGLAAALFGMIVGIPTLRLRGDYLAIATLGFGEIVRVGLLNFEALGGASGFNGRPPFGRIPPYTSVANVYLASLVCVLVVTALKRSTHGRALQAISGDEVAAESVGIDTTRYKVFAFALSAFFAGVAGGLLAHDQGTINPAMFSFMRSIEAICMVVLGGSGSTTGAVLAALLLTGLREGLRDLAEYRMVIYAEILLVVMLVRRQGLLGSREITSRDWRLWGAFLREHGWRGFVRSARQALRDALAAARTRLGGPAAAAFDRRLATFILLLPAVDLLGAWLLPPATQPYPRTYAAEIVASLTQLFHTGCAHVTLLKPLATDIQLPLQPDLGLSAALLLLILPWTQLAYGVAAGSRRAGWGVLAAGVLFAWHGLGFWLAGAHRARTAVEAVGGVALVLATSYWLARRSRSR